MSLSILPFTPERAPYFDYLNRAWIEELFTMEPKDYAVLMHPQEHILAKGGEVWFAAIDGEIIGAAALLVEGPGILEFSKLGVAPSARGKGAARALLRHCRHRAVERGANILRIYTNSKLAPANALYRSEGFIEVQMSAQQRAHYARVDIMYDLPLNRAAT